jgi:caa(3)-type oxidase subunit IV
MARAPALSAAGYVWTYVGLVVAAMVSLLLSFVHWPGGLAVALAIAAAKAFTVMWFFMHLREQRFASGLAMLIAAMFIALLAGLVAADTATRDTFPARGLPAHDDTFYRR